MSTKLEIMIRNLEELERRTAMYGPGTAPLFLLNQIADLREQIRQVVKEELAALQPDDAEQRGRLQRLGELAASGQATESATLASEGVPFVLQLMHSQEEQPQVQVQSSPAGETGPHPLELPYAAETLALVLRALTTPTGRFSASRFQPDEVERLEQLGLIGSGFLLQTMYQTVGRVLYGALFPRPVEYLFHVARSRAADEHRPLALRMVFDTDASTLAVYPWELVHDNVPLVADGVIDLTRYIAFPGPRHSLEVALPLRGLIISPRPTGLPSLPDRAEPNAVIEALRPLAEQGALEVIQLSSPTREALVEHLRQREVHVIHFDGHGGFGRLCPACHILHTPGSEHCTRCGYPLSTAPAQGYLAFEDDGGKAKYVSARAFANALARNRTQVVVLSACRSAQVGGGGVFNGVGPALIQAGVPAVVAMQLTMPVEQAIRFAQSFYASLADFRPLVEAVGRGRQQLYDEAYSPQAWFVPSLYLRSTDLLGDLFKFT